MDHFGAFFQGILLAGYLYVHLSTSWLAGRSQYRLHLMLFLASFAVLPIAIPDSWVPNLHAPVTTYLGLMSITVGLPFFVVATTAPLLQVWFHRALPSRSPYHLYAASDAGGLIALVAYPILLETTLGARLQSQVWTACYVLLVGAIAVLGRAANPSVAIESRPAGTLSASATPMTLRHHARSDGRTPQLIANDRWWVRDEIERIRPWTDDHADVFSRLVWKHMLR